jgi:hypothetical protein
MAEGGWTVGLIPETPRSVLHLVAIEDQAFSTVVVIPVHVDPADFTDAQMLALARYSGRYVSQTDGQLTLGGEGLLGWLGDENDDGDMYVSADGTSGALDFEAQLDARVFTRANGLTKGSVNQSSDTRNVKRETGTTRRQFLDTICHLYAGGPYEYRVNPDGTVDVNRAGALWPTASDPEVILARDGGQGLTAGSSGWLELDGTGDYAQTPDAPSWTLADTITITAKVRLTDYSNGAEQVVLSKWNTTGNQRAYYFGFNATGELVFHWSTNGTTNNTKTSVGASFTNDTDYWVAVDFAPSAGTAVFSYSTDATDDAADVTYTDISTDTGAFTNGFGGTAVVRVGGIVGDTLMPTGRVYAAFVSASKLDTPVGNPNFVEWEPGETVRTDDIGKTWTLNGNAYINGGPGTPVVGLPCELEVPSVDVEDYRTDIVTGNPNTAIVGGATNTPPALWVDFAGDPPVLTSYQSSSPRADFQDHPRRWSARIGANRYAAWVLNSVAQANQMAVRLANSVNTYAVEVKADVNVYDAGRYFSVGDTVYVWDQQLRLSDNAHEVNYRGEPAHPKKLRVQRMEVPIRDGMGVYLRYWDGAAFDYVDLSRYVDYEEGPVRVDLGTKSRFRRVEARPRRFNRRRKARQARRHYRLARYFGDSP